MTTPAKARSGPPPAVSPAPSEHQNDPRFRALVQAAETSVPHLFKLLQVHALEFREQSEELVRKARAVLAFRLDDTPEEEHVIDLKTGPGPIFSTRAPVDAPQDVDVLVTLDSRARLVSLLHQREDGLSAFKSGALKVKGSMRALLKLRGLQDLAARWKEDLLPANAGAPELQDEDASAKEGYLEKRSEWLRRFNSRYVTLRWNDRARPQLRYYNSQAAARSGLPARGFVELHSGYQVLSSEAEYGAWAFALVDKRGNGPTIVLRAPSARLCEEWVAALHASIAARAKALEQAHGALVPAAGPAPAAPANLLDVLLATQRAVSGQARALAALQEELRVCREDAARLKDSAASADEFLICGAIESDWSTLNAWLGWKLVPLAVALGASAVSVGRGALGLGAAFAQMAGRVLGDALAVRDAGRQRSLGVLALVLAASLAARFVEQSPRFELSRRRWRVFSLAASVIWRMKMTAIRAERLPPVHRDAMWAVEFRLNAEKLYALSLELRGLWVKTAQFLGARSDVVPPAALGVLQRLHDAVPPTPFAQVKELVEKELQLPLAKVFGSFDETPLASASIGQVHQATLLSTGASVVVKVQHPRIEPKIRQDLSNMGSILNFIQWLEKATGGDELELKPILDEWSREVVKELDFVSENANMLDVGANLASDESVHAALPAPIPGMCTRRVLAMRFVHGAKINDLDALRRVAGVETAEQRTHLAEDITNAFARQLFVDGIFQADPHPGNILVCKRDAIEPGAVICMPPAPAHDPQRALPVLLDFGLTKRLPREKKLAFSRLICAMQALDVSGLLLSFDEMGLVLKREDPFEDLNEFRFAFRETQGGVESRAETMAHIKKATEKWEAKPRSERNPVEAFPSELMLFFRTVFLLRGLCTSLEVRVKYLKIMGAWAKRSMLESHVAGPLGSPSQSPPRGPKNSLDARVAACLAAHASVLVGAQVVAIKGRAEACNVAVGCVHDLDARRVSRDTLFPCLGLAQGVAQMAALQACREAGLGLDTPVAKVWPAFRDRVLSIGALLSGDTGLLAFAPSALPEVFFVQSMHKTAPLLRFVERISGGPAHGDAAAAGLGESEQGDKVLPWELSTLAFAWGAAVAGLVQALDKGSEDAFARRVAALWPGVLARVPDQDVPAPPPAKTLPEAERARAEAVRRDERERVSGKYASICLDVESLFGGAVDLDKMWEAGPGGGAGAAAAEEGGGGSGGQFDPSTVLKSLPALKGREYFVDPRIFNHWAARMSITPSGNLLCSAASLAGLFASDQTPFPENLSKDVFGERLGLKSLELRDAEGRTFAAVGQVAFGGSFVLACPALELSVACVVNGLTMDRAAPRAALEMVCGEYGLKLVGEM